MVLDNKRTNIKSESYKDSEKILLSTFKKTSIPDDEILENLHLFITPQQIRKILFFYEIELPIGSASHLLMEKASMFQCFFALFFFIYCFYCVSNCHVLPRFDFDMIL